MNNSRSIIFIILFIICFILILEYKEKYFFLYDDNATYYLPFFKYNWEALVNNLTIPFINYHQYLGHLYLGQGQTAVFYPLIYISVAISKILTGEYFATIEILVIIHFLISCVGMYLFLIRIKVLPNISLLCSILWITFPFLTITSKAWIHYSFLFAFLPWNFYLIDKLNQKPGLKNSIILSILKTIYFYQGYIQFLLMTYIFESLFVLFRYTNINLKTFQSWKFTTKCLHALSTNFSKYYFFSILSSLILSAPLLLSMMFLQKSSIYRSVQIPFLDFINNSLIINDFIYSQLFMFRKNVVFSADSELFFIGLIIILVPLFFLIKFRKNSLLYVSLGLSIIPLLLSTKFYSVFYEIPLFNLFRWPFKYFSFFLFFFTMFIAVLINAFNNQNFKLLKKISIIVVLISVCSNIYINFTRIDKYNVAGPYTIINKFPKNLAVLNKDKNGRILTLFVSRNTKKINDFYTFNFASFYNLFDLGGYFALISKTNYNLGLGLDHFGSFNRNVNEKLFNYLNFAGVKYFITQNNNLGNSLSNVNFLESIYRDEEVIIYKNLNAFPLVYYLHETAPIQAIQKNKINYDFAINQINIYPNNFESKVLAVSIAPLKWYRVYIDGVDKGFIKEGIFPIRITIPPKTQRVVIKYISYPFYIGVLVAILFIILLIAYYIFRKKKYKY